MEKARVLIVEDENVIALDLEGSLKNIGYEVAATAASGEEAIAKARELKPDLVLMDIVLKGKVDGVVAAAQIYDSLNIPVVYVTAHADDATLQRAQVTEPFGYILKPFNEAELRAVLEMALYKHRAELKRKTPRSPVPRWIDPVQPGKDESTTSAFDYLRNLELFAGVADPQLRALSSACRFESVPARDVITFEGEESPTPFIVVSGRVAMGKMSADGKELIVELLTPGDPFGLVSALEAKPAPLTARAQVDSRVLWVPRSSFLLLLEDDRQLHRKFTQYVSHRLHMAHEFSRALAHDSVEPRIAAILCSLAKRDGKSKKNCDIEMTRQELAALAGNSLETTIRITKAMERAGLLGLNRRGRIRILDLEKLESIAGT